VCEFSRSRELLHFDRHPCGHVPRGRHVWRLSVTRRSSARTASCRRGPLDLAGLGSLIVVIAPPWCAPGGAQQFAGEALRP